MSEIEARREARRRKILENSEKRLEKITGVQKRNVSFELEGYRSSPTSETHTENLMHNDGYLPIDEPFIGDQLLSQIDHARRNLPRPVSLNPSTGNQNNRTSLNKLTLFKTHRLSLIILVALLVNISLSLFKNHSLLFVNRIFIPFLCFEAIDLLFNKSEGNDDFTKKYLIFFRNVPQYQLTLIVKLLTLVRIIFRDLMVYFFVFICIFYLQYFIVNILYTNGIF